MPGLAPGVGVGSGGDEAVPVTAGIVDVRVGAVPVTAGIVDVPVGADSVEKLELVAGGAGTLPTLEQKPSNPAIVEYCSGSAV